MDRLSVVLALCLTWLPAPAGAQGGAGDRQAARVHAREGTRLFEAGRYREAIAEFEKAYSAKPHFLVQCNIARCHELMGDLREAATHYRRCLDEGGSKSPQAPQLSEALATVEKKLEVQQPPTASGPASVPVTPPPPPPPPPPSPRDRAFWALVGLGAAIELKDLPSQLKLRAAFGYHFFRGLTGPSLGLDLQVGVAGGFTSLEVGPVATWDFALAPAYGLYLGPSLGFGLAHLTEHCVGKTCSGSRTGISLQIGAEARLILGRRGLLTFRPVGLDLVASSGGTWVTSLRYDLLMGGGMVF